MVLKLAVSLLVKILCLLLVLVHNLISPKISFYSVTFLFPDLSEVGMKSEFKENVPSDPGKERKDDEDGLTAPEIDDDQRLKFSQNETESWSETVHGGTGKIASAEESLLGKRSFQKINENASGGTPDRPGRPSVPTPSKGRVVFFPKIKPLLGEYLSSFFC